MHLALFISLFQKDIATGVNDENLAILRHDAFFGTNGSLADRCTRATCSLGSLAALVLVLASFLLLKPALTSIDHLSGLEFLAHGPTNDLAGIANTTQILDARHTDFTPGGVSCKLDVASDKLLLPLPAQVECEPVAPTADTDEQTEQDGPKTGTEPGIVVTGPLPLGKAIAQEKVIPLSPGAAQNIDDNGEAGIAIRGVLLGILDFGA